MGVSVYAFDMWGNGRSSGQRGATDIAQAVADHLAARRELASQSDTRALPTFLFGHSVGGLVTATSVLRDDIHVSGVILASPTLADANGFVRALVGLGALLAPAKHVPGPGGKIETLTALPEIQAELGRDSLYFRRVTWITAASGASLAHENWNRYAAVRAPVLVVHGESATRCAASFSIGSARAFRRLCRCKRGTNGDRHATCVRRNIASDSTAS
jgi:alpha-beta hydrolase superfamily lysophospholipase